MEDGRLTEARGRTVDFRNTVLIMTSNVGAHLAQGEGRLGFRASDDDAGYDFEKMREGMIDAAKRLFRPEFINRVDEIIVFRPLTQADLQKIVRLEIAKVANRLQEHGLSLDVSDAALERLVAEGFDVTYGARPLRRSIQRLVENPLSDELLRGVFSSGDKVLVDLQDGEIVFSKTGE